MGFIAWIILGGLAGWIASLIMKTNRQQGCLLNIVVGVVGALLGGFIFQQLGGMPITGFNPYSLIVAVVGAVVFLWLLKVIGR